MTDKTPIRRRLLLRSPSRLRRLRCVLPGRRPPCGRRRRLRCGRRRRRPLRVRRRHTNPAGTPAAARPPAPDDKTLVAVAAAAAGRKSVVAQAASAKPPAPSAPTAEWQLPPTLAKRYEPLGRLGAGGMGSVVKARNRLLPEQLVAIKRPLQDAAADVRAELASRIAGEAKGLARLSGNSNVARVYDLAEINSELFLVMELVEGVSMDKVVHKRNPFGNAPIGAVGLQALDALAAAHGESILHRDIKPSNFMLTPRGGSCCWTSAWPRSACGRRPRPRNPPTACRARRSTWPPRSGRGAPPTCGATSGRWASRSTNCAPGSTRSAAA